MADGRKYQWLESVMGSKLNNKTKCVGWALFKHANSKTLYCYPNLTTIDEVLGGAGSGKNMHRHIQSLLDHGYIVKHQKKVGHYMSNGYVLAFPDTHDDQAAPQPEETDPHGDLGGHQGDGLTLSRTLSENLFMNSFNEKPSASEIQEEIWKLGNEVFISDSFSSGIPARQNAARPHVADSQEKRAWRQMRDEIPNEEW